MYDSGKIIIGLVIFVGFFTFAFWANMGKAVPAPKPKVDTPVIKQMAERRCVEDTHFMRTTHMQLLNDWRDEALRKGNRNYTNKQGHKHIISLQNTCMNCHSNKAGFCDKCHTYAGVTPYCWNCHLEPQRPEGGEL